MLDRLGEKAMDYDTKDSDSVLQEVDCLRDRRELDRTIDYDHLKRGDYFLLQKNCPACNSTVLGVKEQDFQCQKCYLIFRFEKK